MAYRDTILADSPVDYYEFESATGTDSGSGNRTLTLSGGITTGVAGMIGNGWTFDGVNDSASMGTFPTLTNAFTFEAWVKPNLAGVNDTPTIIRRDGTDIHLLRVRGSALGVNPGQAEVYADGLTLVSGSSYRVDDGNWHHIVYTQSGNSARLYVDGIERASGTTTQSTFNMGTGPGYIGSANGTGEFFKGTMDEVAIYNTALSAQKVADHYSAGSGIYNVVVNPTYDATWTISPEAQGSTTAAFVEVDSFNFARFRFSKAAMFGTKNVNILSAKLRTVIDTVDSAQIAYVRPNGDATKEKAFRSAETPVNTAHEWDVASIITGTSGDTVTVDLRRASGSGFVDFKSNETSLPANKPTLTVQYEEVPLSVTVDVATVTASVATQDVTVETVRSTEFIAETLALSVLANDVVVEVTSNAVVVLDTATASLSAHEASAETVLSPDVYNDVSTARTTLSAAEVEVGISHTVEVSDTDTVMMGAYDPTVEMTQGVVVDLDTPNATVINYRLSEVNGEPVLPTETEDRYFMATLDTLTGVRRGFEGGLAGLDKDSAIDPAFQVWFRMNEKSGATAYDRLWLTDANTSNTIGQVLLNLSNVTVGQNSGPEGRHAFYFNGDAYAQQNSDRDAMGERESGIEFTFRTEKKTQFIMGNADSGGNLSVLPATQWELWLVDGRLEVRTWRVRSGFQNYEILPMDKYTGFKDYADGEWHHVVLQAGYESWRVNGLRSLDANDWGLELHVDSKLELRRRIPAMAVAGFPDFIGGRPSSFYANVDYPVRAIDELPRTSWFVGDMTELVYRYGRVLSEDEIARQRDTMFGIFPVYADPARLVLETEDAVVKGNKPRMLVLHFDAPSDITERAVDFTLESQVRAAMEASPDTLLKVEPPSKIALAFVGIGESVTHYPMGDKSKWPDRDYLKFEHHVLLPLGEGSRTYRRDPVTDNYRLIDLGVDLNMDDYDIISIVGYPGNEEQLKPYDAMDAYNAQPMVPARKQLEGVVAQVKSQVIDNGKSLFVADPFSAIALGIVDQVDVVPELLERAPRALTDIRIGAINPGYDGHAFATDPFGGAIPATRLDANGIPRVDWAAYAARGNKLARAARYTDTHANTKQRVRALVDGLTDIGAYIKTDEMQWWNVNPFNEPPFQISRKYADKRAGLSVGDEFHLDAPAFADLQYRSFNLPTDALVWKHNGFRVAAPMSAVKVGTVVTSFGLTHYSGLEEAAGAFEGPLETDAKGNPYYDHAISIAIQPGDAWDGKTVKGKVYVNFTESRQFQAEQTNVEQTLAWGDDAANSLEVGQRIRHRDGYEWQITPDMAQWDWSTHFATYSSTEIKLPDAGSGPDWGWSAGGSRGSGTSGGAAYALSWSINFLADELPIWVPTMSERALKWLATDLDLDGSANVNTDTVEVDVKANDVTVETSSNAFVDLSTARVTVESYTDSDTENPDANVMAGTATVLFKASGVNSDVAVESAGIAVRTSEVSTIEEIVDWSEAIVLQLPRQIITLTLEDN